MAVFVTSLTMLISIGAAPAAGEHLADGTITGLVTDGGAPVGGVSVWASNLTGGQTVATNDDGRYVITGLNAGPYSVGLVVDGTVYQPVSTAFLQLTDESPTVTYDVALERHPVGTSTVSGTVTDGDTGLPLWQAMVGIGTQSGYFKPPTWTDDLGRYDFSLLPAGSYNLSFSAPGYVAKSVAVTVQDDHALVVDAALTPANSSITGTVSDAAGHPISSALISVSLDGNPIELVESDDLGAFEIDGVGGLGPGTYLLSLGGPWTPYIYQEVAVTTIANEVTHVDIVIERRTTATLGGYVLNADASASVEGICAVAYRAGSKDPAGHDITSPEATFLIADLLPGTYTVKFSECDPSREPAFETEYLGDATKLKDAALISVSAGEDAHVGEIRVDVKSDKGKAKART